MHVANSIILWSCISEIVSKLFKYICFVWSHNDQLTFIKKEGAEKGVDQRSTILTIENKYFFSVYLKMRG